MHQFNCALRILCECAVCVCAVCTKGPIATANAERDDQMNVQYTLTKSQCFVSIHSCYVLCYASSWTQYKSFHFEFIKFFPLLHLSAYISCMCSKNDAAN